MHLGSLRDVLKRHWPLTIAALCLTLAGMLQVSTMVKPEYTTQGSVVLIPPANIDQPKSNRYLSLGVLDQAVGVLIRSLMSEQSQKAVEAKAPHGTYLVVPDYTTSAPILVVTATGDSRSATEKILKVALASIPQVLTNLQQSIGVEQTEQITTQGLTHDSKASLVLKPVIRAMLGAAVLLMGVCFGLIALTDGIQQRRRRRRAEVGPAVEPVGPVEAAVDEGYDEADAQAVTMVETLELVAEDSVEEADDPTDPTDEPPFPATLHATPPVTPSVSQAIRLRRSGSSSTRPGARRGRTSRSHDDADGPGVPEDDDAAVAG